MDSLSNRFGIGKRCIYKNRLEVSLLLMVLSFNLLFFNELDLYPKALFEDLFPGSIMSQYYDVNLAFSNGEVVLLPISSCRTALKAERPV